MRYDAYHTLKIKTDFLSASGAGQLRTLDLYENNIGDMGAKVSINVVD